MPGNGQPPTKEELDAIISEYIRKQRQADKGKWKHSLFNKLIGVISFALGIGVLAILSKAIAKNWDFFFLVWIFIPFLAYWLTINASKEDTTAKEFGVTKIVMAGLEGWISLCFLLDFDKAYTFIRLNYIDGGEWYLYFGLFLLSLIIIPVLLATPVMVWKLFKVKKM